MNTLRGFRATTTRTFAGAPLRAAGSVAPGSLPGPGSAFECGGPGGDPPADLPDVGDLVGGLYRLVRVLGAGNFGRVFVAQRIDVPEHQVALKILSRALYTGRNVARELVMLAAASHPNIVQLKDHGATDRYVWFTMPVYDGETLAARLERGTLSLADAHAIFLPIARALDALHTAGLRHQDIKPENVFLASFAGQLHPILLDLGVAAEREAQFVAGTVVYASPEQIFVLRGAHEDGPRLSEKMDTYCFGATLLAALVGPEHFPGEQAETLEEIARAHEARAEHPLSAAALPAVRGRARELLSDALRRWLAPDPADRPSMCEVAQQLEVLLEPERELARAEQRRCARRRTARRALLVAFTAASAAAGLAVYAKRETFRLANELARARADGAASFDKLDTCVASYRVADHEAHSCRDERTRERAAFQAALDKLARSGSVSEAEHARALQAVQATYAARLRSCEEAADWAEKAARQERDRKALEHGKREAELAARADACTTELAAARDRLDRSRHLDDVRANELAASRENLDRCRADLASCEDHRRQPAGAADRPPVAARTSGDSPRGAATSGGALPSLPPPPPDRAAAPTMPDPAPPGSAGP